jgi:hypothetical protein
LKPEERDPILYLEDIALSMQRIQEYISGLDFQHFKQDYKTVDAVFVILKLSVRLQKTYLIISNPNIPMFHGKKCTVYETA